MIPSIASAAWWNPFSWNIFKGDTVPEVQVITPVSDDTAQKIQELQKQIDELKKVRIVPVIIPEPKTIVTPVVVPPVVPVPKPTVQEPMAPTIIDGIKQRKLEAVYEKIDDLNAWYDRARQNILDNEIGASQSGIDMRLNSLDADYEKKYRSLELEIKKVQSGVVTAPEEPKNTNTTPKPWTGGFPGASA